MLRRVLGAGAYARIVKKYPIVRVFILLIGVVRWLAGRRQKRNDRLHMVDIDLADDEVLVLTREKMSPNKRGDSYA